MTIKEFETRLQSIDPLFTIVQHPNNPELAGVYYDRNVENKTGFVVTVPALEIFEDANPSYQDSTGHAHNWASKVEFVCKEHLRRMEEEEGYKELFYEVL